MAVDNRTAVCVAKLYLYFFDRRFSCLPNGLAELEPDAIDEFDNDKEVSSFEFVLVASND